MVVDVSIVSANFNNSLYLKDYFESLLHSTYYPREIIIVDDSSTDNSVEIIKNYKIPNLNLICLEQNVGFSNALNVGVAIATSKYIMRLDPDDFIDNKKIELQYNYLENHCEIDVLGSNAYYFNDRLKKIISSSNFKLDHKEISNEYSKGRHGVIHGTIMCKSAVLKENKYRQENFPAEEYDIFSRILLNNGKFCNLNENLLYYRIHGKSVSNKMPFSTIKKTFNMADTFFGTKKSSLSILFDYFFLRNYRLYLYNYSSLKGLMYLFVSVLFKPTRLLKRIVKSFES